MNIFIIFIKIHNIDNMENIENMDGNNENMEGNNENMQENNENNENTLKYIKILRSYATNILGILNTSNEDTMIVVKRIFHILNIFLRNHKVDTIERQIKFNSILTSISFAPPWDTEDVIFDHLENLCIYLSNYYPNNDNINNSVIENIKNIKLEEEIKKILLLDI